METVPPRAVPQSLTSSAPAPTAQISTPPPDIQRLQIGTKLDALVLQAVSKGSTEISTSFGKLQLSTQYPLPANANIQLQVIGKFPLFQLLITSVQGQSPKSLLRVPGQDGASSALLGKQAPKHGAGAPGLTSATVRPASASVNLTVGTQVIATKIGTAGSSVTAPALQQAGPAGPPTSPGTSTALPGAQTATTPTGIKSLTHAVSQTIKAVGTAPVSSGPSAQMTSSENAILNQAGSRFSVRIVSLVPPSQLANGGGLPATGNNQFSIGQTATGVVSSTNSQGQAIVQTHAGPVSLATPTPLPTGTTLSFLINGPLSSGAVPSSVNWGDRNAAIIMETQKWPELDDALRTLSESQPNLAQQVTNALLPKADTTLAANILLLLAAIRGGDIRNWFGDGPARTLQRIRPDLMGRLQDDFAQLSRLADDTTNTDWRSYPLPFLNGQDIEQIRLHIKHRSEDENDEDEAGQGARFVIDLNLSQLGRLQLDGLVKTQNKQFDLIIRSDEHLSKTMQNNIRSIFQKAMDLTNNKGGLTFQAAPANFLSIQATPHTSAETGLVV